MNFDFVMMVKSIKTWLWTNIHTGAHCTWKRTIPRHNKAHNCHVFSTSIFALKIIFRTSTHFTTSPQVNDFFACNPKFSTLQTGFDENIHKPMRLHLHLHNNTDANERMHWRQHLTYIDPGSDIVYKKNLCKNNCM